MSGATHRGSTLPTLAGALLAIVVAAYGLRRRGDYRYCGPLG